MLKVRCLPVYSAVRSHALPLLFVAAAVLTVPASPAISPALADGQYQVLEENDSILHHTDKHYTQGLRFSYLSDPTTKGDTFNGFFDTFSLLFPSDGTVSRHTDWAIGQSIFTPGNTAVLTPNPKDRPYAGWLYGEFGLIQDTNNRQLDHLSLQLGVVGPDSFAQQTQNDFHLYALQINGANGWSHQLDNEPGFDLNYDRKWRFLCCAKDQGWGVDLIPDAGVQLGNVMTDASLGTVARLGYNLTADYGVPRILPSQSGSDYFEPNEALGELGGYVYAGAEGRAVGQNIFLDGNTFQHSASVTKFPLVGDLNAGAVMFYGPHLRLTLSNDYRTKEFVSQNGPDRFTSVVASTNFTW